MQPELDALARSADETARALRRLPTEVRRAMSQRMKPEVAEPLAARVRSAGSSVYGRRVAATAKARAGANPTVVVGGTQRVVSGGGTGRQIVFGAMFGGGSRIAIIRSRRARTHLRHTTRQFAGERDAFVPRAVRDGAAEALTNFATIANDTIDRELD